MKRKNYYEKIRDQGEIDFKSGKTIDAFYDMPLAAHTELSRASYEIGWNSAKAVSLQQLRQAEKQDEGT